MYMITGINVYVMVMMVCTRRERRAWNRLVTKVSNMPGNLACCRQDYLVLNTLDWMVYCTLETICCIPGNCTYGYTSCCNNCCER
jgi:hypothetical protein